MPGWPSGMLGRRDPGGTRPGSAYRETGASAGAGGAGPGGAGGQLILPGSPLVSEVAPARFTTGRVHARSITMTSGEDLGGPVVRTWSYDGMVPGRVIRVTKGDIVRATFTNRVAQPTTVHGHGGALRNDALVTQLPIGPGAAFTYQFGAGEPGTYWYHPHVGAQQDRGLYGC